MTSLARRLVVYFVLLAVVPLAAGFLGFTAVIERSEQSRLDEGLQTGLRAALAVYDGELLDAQRSAEKLARVAEFQRALARHDRAALRGFLADDARLRLESGKIRIRNAPANASERRVQIIGPRGALGELIAFVSLDQRYLRKLATSAGLTSNERLVLVDGTHVRGPIPLRGSGLELDSQGVGTISLGGERYRIVASRPVVERGPLRLALVTPEARAQHAATRTELRLFLLLTALLLLMGTIAFFEGKAIVRSVGELAAAARAIARGQLSERVPVRGRDEFANLALAFNQMAEQLEERLEELGRERVRLKEATLRFGEGLGASDDITQLLRVVVESAVEATRATGGVVVGPGGERFTAGEPEKGAEQLEWPLRAGREQFGTLILTGPHFSEDELETAALLCGHAAVALDNARLHRIVERQALVDGLTGLANRRRSEAALDEEIVRALRLGSEMTFVLLDIDHFKRVNDTHGHPAGDAVLKDVAVVLGESVREIDTAGRWGGEEFALVLPGTDLAGGVQLAERIRIAIERRTISSDGGEGITVTASFGVANLGQAGDRERLLADADAALYRAKRAGRNRVEGADGRPLS